MALCRFCYIILRWKIPTRPYCLYVVNTTKRSWQHEQLFPMIQCVYVGGGNPKPTSLLRTLKSQLGWITASIITYALHWCHNGRISVSNHQPHDCLLSRLFRRRSKKKSKLRVTGLCARNSPGPVNSPHKGPVTREMVPFDDVIMWDEIICLCLMRQKRGITDSVIPH